MAVVLLSCTPEVRGIDRRLSLVDMFNERFCIVDASNLHGIAYLFRKIQHAKNPPITSIEGWAPVGTWRRFVDLFINPDADFLLSDHRCGIWEVKKAVHHGIPCIFR